ncbi:MAG: hypothetical protein AAGC57_03385 [Pseudomonadota bacterium]
MLPDILKDLLSRIDPRVIERTKALQRLETKVAQLSKRLEPWESRARDMGPHYELAKTRIDKRRSNIYAKIVSERIALDSIWADHGVDDTSSIAFIESLEDDAATKAAAAAKWDTLSPEEQTQAA